MDYTVYGILQVRILEWVAFPFSRVSFQSRDQTQLSHIGGGLLSAEPLEKPNTSLPHIFSLYLNLLHHSLLLNQSFRSQLSPHFLMETSPTHHQCRSNHQFICFLSILNFPFIKYTLEKKRKNIYSACVHAQSCLTLCDPMGWSLPGSAVHGILQARILEWVGISFF